MGDAPTAVSRLFVQITGAPSLYIYIEWQGGKQDGEILRLNKQ